MMEKCLPIVKIVLLLSAAAISACAPVMTTPILTEEPVLPTATATIPHTAEPISTPSSAPAPTVITAPTKSESVCLALLTPEDRADLPGAGAVLFSWEPVEGAALYQLKFFFPAGVDLTLESEETRVTRYMEAFSMHPAYQQGGEHQWSVTALNAEGETICTSPTFIFTKP